jgi:hypothetical protein
MSINAFSVVFELNGTGPGIMSAFYQAVVTAKIPISVIANFIFMVIQFWLPFKGLIKTSQKYHERFRLF